VVVFSFDCEDINKAHCYYSNDVVGFKEFVICPQCGKINFIKRTEDE